MKKDFFKSDAFCYIVTILLDILGISALLLWVYFFGDEIIANWCKYI